MKTIILDYENAEKVRADIEQQGYTRYFIDTCYEYYSKGEGRGTRYIRLETATRRRNAYIAEREKEKNGIQKI